jgi:hypothetical protein
MYNLRIVRIVSVYTTTIFQIALHMLERYLQDFCFVAHYPDGLHAYCEGIS